MTIGARALMICVLHAPVPEAPDPEPFRLVTHPCFHLGVRPATDSLSLSDFAVTVQWTYCTPW